MNDSRKIGSIVKIKCDYDSNHKTSVEYRVLKLYKDRRFGRLYLLLNLKTKKTLVLNEVFLV